MNERRFWSSVFVDFLAKGRPVYIFDGTTVSMPDTPKNQADYPQVYTQKPGLEIGQVSNHRSSEYIRAALLASETGKGDASSTGVNWGHLP